MRELVTNIRIFREEEEPRRWRWTACIENGQAFTNSTQSYEAQTDAEEAAARQFPGAPFIYEQIDARKHADMGLEAARKLREGE